MKETLYGIGGYYIGLFIGYWIGKNKMKRNPKPFTCDICGGELTFGYGEVEGHADNCTEK